MGTRYGRAGAGNYTKVKFRSLHSHANMFVSLNELCTAPVFRVLGCTVKDLLKAVDEGTEEERWKQDRDGTRDKGDRFEIQKDSRGCYHIRSQQGHDAWMLDTAAARDAQDAREGTTREGSAHEQPFTPEHPQWREGGFHFTEPAKAESIKAHGLLAGGFRGLEKRGHVMISLSKSGGRSSHEYSCMVVVSLRK